MWWGGASVVVRGGECGGVHVFRHVLVDRVVDELNGGFVVLLLGWIGLGCISCC